MTGKIKSTNNDGINEWSKLYGKTITEDEYSEICHNLNGFFSLLHQWYQQEKNQTASESPLQPTKE